MTEAWVTGLVDGILYNAMYHSDCSELDDELARHYAHAMRVQPLSREPLPRQAAGLRAVVASDEALASRFEPYPGRRPFGEAELRDFLTRIADEVDRGHVQGEPEADRLPDEPGPNRIPDGPGAERPRGLRALLRRRG
ncbi:MULTISPECIES: hypothetical protein [unclassified Streptomyces]|uniref:hypothetical protein n=1 Tax=unclassified Streptomyces TaxID=2593676 RepID=UPI000DC7AD95|nr:MULTISPECIES: hypothetical protein [unclassified Streptomyces]AWZ05549.1 hypothetical protein DRB89_13730 [Streptomyces sp. ICC4]AWZ13743.1 hypothetical protein DRB96_17155 [Streptomyces sp. ICC1]